MFSVQIQEESERLKFTNLPTQLFNSTPFLNLHYFDGHFYLLLKRDKNCLEGILHEKLATGFDLIIITE